MRNDRRLDLRAHLGAELRVFVAVSVAVSLGACPNATVSAPTPLVATATAVPATSTSFVSVQGLTDDDVRNYLVSLAFSSGLTVNTVLKWQEPVSVFLHGAFTPEDRTTIEGIMDELTTLTGLRFSFAAS